LAAVLAQAREQEAAKAVVSSCVGTANAERLRSLGPGALYRFFVLQGTFGVRLREPALTDLAGRLLPPEMRAEVGVEEADGRRWVMQMSAWALRPRRLRS